MKSNLRPRHFIAALGLAAFSASGSATTTPAGPVLPPSNAVVAISVSDDTPGTGPGLVSAAMPGPASDFVQWTDIEFQPYALRSLFMAGLKRMETLVDNQIGELTAKRDALTNPADTQNCDYAIKQMGHARSYLKYRGEELGKATPGNWDQAKVKVGLAWARTQKFYTMGKSGNDS